ncbi:MAG: DMT family transporter [Acidihalobacter sp.]|uniref:DMT family transporter n=1 Tax=Acidihalobacter sp. TaxID=1872108 RepID=UPI00307CCBAB
MHNGGQTGARLALLSVSAVWGLTFVVVADAVSVTNPYMFNAARFALGAALVGLVVAMRGGLRTAGLVRHLRYGVVLGTLLFGGFITQTIGLQSTTPGKAGFITGLSVVLVPFFSHFLLGIRVRRIEAVAAGVSLLGLFLLSLTGGVGGVVVGDAYVLVCALFFGLHIVVTDRFVKHTEVSVGVLTLVQLSVVLLLSLAFSAGLYGDLAVQASVLADPKVYVGVVVCGVLATAYAYLVQTGMQRRVGPTQVALIFIMEPVFAGLFDYLFDGRLMNAAQLLGAGLIVLAMGMTEIRLPRRREARAPL